MKSCFSLVKHMNTEEVMPAKHVIDAALTFKGKAERGILLGNQKKKIINIWKTQAQNVYMYIEKTSTISSPWLVIENTLSTLRLYTTFHNPICPITSLLLWRSNLLNVTLNFSHNRQPTASSIYWLFLCLGSSFKLQALSDTFVRNSYFIHSVKIYFSS